MFYSTHHKHGLLTIAIMMTGTKKKWIYESYAQRSTQAISDFHSARNARAGKHSYQDDKANGYTCCGKEWNIATKVTCFLLNGLLILAERFRFKIWFPYPKLVAGLNLSMARLRFHFETNLWSQKFWPWLRSSKSTLLNPMNWYKN